MDEPQFRYITFGLLWTVSGIVWLYRSTRDDADPSTPTTLFTEPEVKSSRARGWQTGLGVANLTLGIAYLISAIVRAFS